MFQRRGNGWVVQAKSRLVPTAHFALVVLVEAPGLSRDAGRPGLLAFDAIIVGTCLLLGGRSWRSATLIVDSREVVVRSLLRTRRWPRSAVEGFVVGTRLIGPGRWPRRVIGIAFCDGTTRWLNEINCRPGRAGRVVWIDQASVALNESSRDNRDS